MFQNLRLEETAPGSGLWIVRNKQMLGLGDFMRMRTERAQSIKSSAKALIEAHNFRNPMAIPGNYLLVRKPSATTGFSQMLQIAASSGGTIISIESGLFGALYLSAPYPEGFKSIIIGHMPVSVAIREGARRVPKRLALLEAGGADPELSTWDVGRDDQPLHQQVDGVLFRLL